MLSPIKLSSDSNVSEYSNEVEVDELTQPQAHSGKPFDIIICTCINRVDCSPCVRWRFQPARCNRDNGFSCESEAGSICESPVDFVRQESSSGV